jgi:hypothetical protein
MAQPDSAAATSAGPRSAACGVGRVQPGGRGADQLVDTERTDQPANGVQTSVQSTVGWAWQWTPGPPYRRILVRGWC